ncbi:MAG TPA: DUF5916 domain-containing protein [Chitinophagales bacterium]|nr:DUF5916 domain-containing protein [Chitinophagales bacterium]
MIKKFSILVYLLATVFFFKNSFAQQQPYHPLRINNTITLDGKLSEPEWQLAPVMDDFMQTDPYPGDTPTEKTEARILYNDEYLYVSFRCYDSEPSKILRLRFERDYNLGDDDGTGFILDTYHDKNTAVCFCSNTLNARWDCQILNDGNDNNDSYNTFWDVATNMDSLGYTTEYRVPWSSLRFEAKPQVVMGIRVARLVRRKFELTTYPRMDPKTQNGWENVSFARDIVFENLVARSPFYFSPYVIANYSQENVLNPDGTGYDKKSEFLVRKNYVDDETLDKILSNIGADAKYGLSKNFTLDLTLNTDFAQAEVDDQIINLTKYEVNLPEKRNFFLESSDNLSYGFPSGNDVFISRSIGNEDGVIVPIIGGVRVTGKSNGWQIGTLDMQTKGFEEDSIAPHNFFVFRTRKDIDPLGSFVGGILTNRINTDSSHSSNQSFGVDFVKRFTQQLSMEGGIAATLLNADFKPVANSIYYNLGIFRSATKGFVYSGYVDLVGKDFNPVIGYLDESDHGLASATVGYQLLAGDKSSVEYWTAQSNNSYRWRMTSGNRETFSSDLSGQIAFKSQALIYFTLYEYKIDSLFYDWYLDDHNAIPAGTYRMFNNSLTLNLPSKSVYTGALTISYGDFYGGKRLFISPDASYSFNKHFSVGVTYEYNRIPFDHYLQADSSTLYQSNLVRLRVAYIFSTKVSLKLYTQFDDVHHSITSNLRFRYNPREGTDLYIVINQGQNTEVERFDPHLPRISNQEVTVKFVKTFGL